MRLNAALRKQFEKNRTNPDWNPPVSVLAHVRLCPQCNTWKMLDEFRIFKRVNGILHYRKVCKACLEQKGNFRPTLKRHTPAKVQAPTVDVDGTVHVSDELIDKLVLASIVHGKVTVMAAVSSRIDIRLQILMRNMEDKLGLT